MTDKEILDAVIAEIKRMMAEEMEIYHAACKDGDEEASGSPVVYTRLQMLLSKVEEKSEAFTEAHKGETSEEILAQMRGEEPVCEDFEKALASEWKGYNDSGAAIVDALEYNTQELAFAKGFYRGSKWKKEQIAAILSKCTKDLKIDLYK